MKPHLMVVALLATAGSAVAADLGGFVFHDLNRNGIRDPGESGVAAAIEVYGHPDTGAPIDRTIPTQSDGSFYLGSADVADGCYVVRMTPPANYRLALPRNDCPGMALGKPVGTRRYGSPRGLIDRLRGGSLLHISLGDSINEPASGCVILTRDATDYIKWLGRRLACVDPGVVTDNEAIGGKLSHDLLMPAGTCDPPNIPVPGDPADRCDNILDTIARGAELVSISIGGNDWLGSEPNDQTEPFTPGEVRASIDALLSARQNLQELLSVLATELPTTDVIVNSVHDNLAPSCASTDFHDLWIPLWNQMLRDVTWGQGDRFSVVEVYPEYAHSNLNGANCCGERSSVCLPGIDGIHPNVHGAKLHLEKAWDAVGGVNLGAKDGIGATSNPNVDFPLVELVTTRTPSAFTDLTSGVISPASAYIKDSVGAVVPPGDGSFAVDRFDANPDGIAPTQVVVAVRYRTGPAPIGDAADGYWLEASVDGSFATPAYTVTGWNTVVPIVGAGPTALQPNSLPAVASWREVRASLTKNLADDGRATGSYAFDAIDWTDISTLGVRLRRVVRGLPDTATIELDAAWLEVYGFRAGAGFTVYRSEDVTTLAGSPLTTVVGGPFADSAPPALIQFYAVDDGAGRPARIDLVRRGAAGVELRW